jgi:hypothetical protein
MYVAGSNPCFEFWLLLHIKDITEYTDNELSTILDNAKVSSNRTYLDKLLSDLLVDGYNKTNPKPHRFITNLALAIERAETLDTPNEEFPSKLGSHVYKIAKAIVL